MIHSTPILPHKTPKQRLRIYKKVLDIFQSDDNQYRFLCVILEHLTGRSVVSWSHINIPPPDMELFPEFMAMKPSDIKWPSPWFESNNERTHAMNSMIKKLEKKLNKPS